jgi:hypothetical protein
MLALLVAFDSCLLLAIVACCLLLCWSVGLHSLLSSFFVIKKSRASRLTIFPTRYGLWMLASRRQAMFFGLLGREE